MSAKCTYSKKFEPLVLRWKERINNQDEFVRTFSEYFTNNNNEAETIWAGGTIASNPVDPFSIKKGNLMDGSLISEASNSRGMYVGNPEGFRQMEQQFITDIVSRILYDPRTGKWTDPTQKVEGSDFSFINTVLFEYKLSLIEKITGIRPNLDINSSNINNELTEAINNALAKYNKTIKDAENPDSNYQYYVILANFNSLLRDVAPFIELNDIYKNRKSHGVDMYNYIGPKANLRQNWDNGDIIGIQDQYSGLSKILLSVIPEVNKDNRVITGTSITSSGYAAVMSTLKSAFYFSNDKKIKALREEYFSSGKLDLDELIDAYLEMLENQESGVAFKKDYKTFLTDKLRGIKQGIFHEKRIPQNIKDIFTRMFFETVPLRYRTYGKSWKNSFGGMNLDDSWKNNQYYKIQDTLNAKINSYRQNERRRNDLQQTWGIEVENDSVKFVLDNNHTLTIKIIEDGNTISFKAVEPEWKKYAHDQLPRLIYQMTGMYVTPEYIQRREMYNKDLSYANDFLGMLAISASIIFGNANNTIVNDNYDSKKQVVRYNRHNLFWSFDTAATIFAIVRGADTANVVKDINGNNLPTKGLTSLAYELVDFAERFSKIGWSVYGKNNLLHRNREHFGEPMIQEGIKGVKSNKKITGLSEIELYEKALAFDFLGELDEGTIYLQPTTNADKTKIFVIPVDINEDFSIDASYDLNIKEQLNAIINGRRESGVQAMELAMYRIRSNRYEQLERNILDRYKAVFERPFNSIIELDQYLKENNIKYNDLYQAFLDNGQEFVDEVIAVKDKDGYARMNETLVSKISIYNEKQDSNGFRLDGADNFDQFQKKMDRCKRRFAWDLLNSGFKLNYFTSKGGKMMYERLVSSNPKWVNTNTKDVYIARYRKKGTTDEWTYMTRTDRSNRDLLLDSSYEVEINPVMEAYFYVDDLITYDYNHASIGEEFAHKLKDASGDPNKKDFDISEYEEFSEAGRWIASVKRNVIPGASLHPFLQGKKDGVASEINIAVMEDISADNWNFFLTHVDDSHDGSGLASIFEIMLEQNSLADAGTNSPDLKTIGWDLDPELGIPRMLKWAVYGLTNERRRLGALSSANVENLFKRMHNIKFSESTKINVQKYFNKFNSDGNGFYFTNFETGITYHVTNVINNSTYGSYRVAYVMDGDQQTNKKVYLDSKNEEFDLQNISSANLALNTIYDLDQFFGGAWSKKMNSEQKLVDADFNTQVVFDIICNENLKDKFIAYAVNKSAFKVGYTNVNKKDAWFNDDALHTFKMSTRHIGLQMNADHELLDSEVTEMTQMISALSENWYAGEIVKQIYEDIGSVIEESLSSLNRDLADDLKKRGDKIRLRLGKALIESFDKEDDTIGLAQAFLDKARRILQDGGVPNIPFSAATINGKLIAEIASRLTKKGIRRKYDGIAAVLTPSFNMISYFNYNRNTGETDENGIPITESVIGLSSDVASEIRNIIRTEHPELKEYRLYDLCHNAELPVYDEFGRPTGKVMLNRLVDEIIDKNDLQEGDTIIEETINSKGSIEWSKPITLDSWEKYNNYVNIGTNKRIYRMRYAPRDLKGANTSFMYNGKRRSALNFATVQAAHQVNAKIPSTGLADLIIADSYFKSDVVGNFINGKWVDVDYKQTMRNIIQHQLEDLEKGIVHDRNFGLSSFTTTDETTVEIVNDVVVTDVQVEAGECIMGKMNAEKFGLIEGDRIDQILKQGADFFYDRFKNRYGEFLDMDKDLYDGVIYTSEGPIFIHFGNFENNEQLNKLSRNTHITQVDDDLVIGNYVLGSAENKTVYSYNTGQKQYDVICINAESLQELLNSEIADTIKWNVKRNNVQQIKTFLDPNNTKYGNIFSGQMQNAVSADQIQQLFETQLQSEFEDERRNLAQRRFYAFKKSLEIVGARIPTQAMQSFMPMKIVAFTNSTHNDIYIPRSQTWLQGSDYDVDKVYCLGYSIAKNGTLPTLSRLDKWFDVEEVLRLGKPNGKEYTQKKRGGFKVSLQELNAVTGMLEGIGTNALPLFGGDVTSNTGKSKLDVFRRIIQSGQTEITFEEPSTAISGDQIFFTERKEAFDRARNRFIELLNLHSQSNVKQNVEAALRNYVVQGINDVSRKPSVQINALSPIDMSEAQDAAKNSPLGQLEKHFSSEIPSSKWKLQEQALGGKDVVGIAAVSVKCFFAETTYFNTVLDDIANIFVTASVQTNPTIKAQLTQQAFDMLKNLVMRNPLDGKWSLVANANVKRVLQKLNGIDSIVLTEYDSSFLNGYSGEEKALLWEPISRTFNLSTFLTMLDKRANIVDAALSESGLLSSATDNMKELILPKLQATAAFVDIYTTLLATGVKFDDIAKIMTSSAFTEITRLVNANIFDISTDGYSLERAIDFFVNLKTLPHVKSGLIKSAFSVKDGANIQSMSQTEDNSGNSEWKTILSDSNLVKKALNTLYKQRSIIAENQYYNRDISDYLDDVFDGTAEENEEPWKTALSDASLEDLNLAINFLEEVLIRNSFIDNLNLRETRDKDYKKLIEYGKIKPIVDQLSDLSKIKEYVLPKTEEQRIFGMMLGINQGLRTDAFEMHKLIRNIENFVSRKVNNGEEFDLMRFLSDEVYQNKWISLYDKVKASFNILHAIRRVPHFSKMFDVLYLNHELQQHLSAKTQIVEALARGLERDNQYPIPDRPYNKILSEKEYKAVQNYVNEWFIMGWFNDQDLSFSFNDASIGYYTEHNRSKLEGTVPIGKVISLSDPTGLANFKHWMEEEVIPALKERYPDNPFIQHLEKGFSENKRTGKVMGSYRLPLNMMTIDESSFTQMIYTSYLNAFNEISLEYYGKEGSQWTIGDLFFVYNLICNKDGFGQHSLTRIFENLVSAKKGTSIINSYYDYVAQLDKQFKEDRKEFIKNMQLEGSDILEDLATKIEFEVQNSSIKPKDKSLKKEYESQTEDFTFYAVKTSKDWRINKSRVLSSVRQRPKRTIGISGRTITQGVLDNLIANYGENNITVLDSQDYNSLSGNDSSNGFIDKGKVYLKRDTGRLNYGTIAHEFAHVILAGLRFNPSQNARDFYYRIIGLIDMEEAKQDSGLRKVIDEYSKTKMGIDLKEEIFAKYLEGWLYNKIDTNSKVLLTIDENSDIIQDTINVLFGTQIRSVEDLLSFTTSDIIEAINIFGSSLFNLDFKDTTHYLRTRTAQVVSALKKMLLDNNIWIYKCD